MARIPLLRSLLHFGGKDILGVIRLLWLLVSIGLLSLLIPAIVRWTAHDIKGGWTTIGTGLFLAGAATLTGSVIGFLFGVPRKNPAPSDRGKAETAGTELPVYEPNTNLEQISDWLTKIIVGVGLVELGSIIHFFEKIGHFAGPAFADAPSGEIIAISICVHYLFVGFIQGFLLAYLWLPGAFVRASRQAKEDLASDSKEVV
jgi:hypothetical protein